MSNNYIKDISVLAKSKFNELRLIDLRNNKIEDINVFSSFQADKLKLLQCIYLSGNKFDSEKFSKECYQEIAKNIVFNRSI